MGNEHIVKNIVKYTTWNHHGEPCVIIYGLFVHKKMRNRGIATIMLNVVINEIKEKYPNIPIKAQAIPYGDNEGLNTKQLESFYSKYGIEIIK